MKTRFVSLFAAALLFSNVGYAAATRTGECSATFSGKGPAGFKIEGKANELSLVDDGKNVTIKVPLAKLETGIDLRDRHMREKYLEVEKYPEAVLQLLRSSVKLPGEGQKTEGNGKGKMTIRGKTRDVKFKYVIERKGGTYQTRATLPLNLKDYDIKVPSYLGVTVKPDIETAVDFAFEDK